MDQMVMTDKVAMEVRVVNAVFLGGIMEEMDIEELMVVINQIRTLFTMKGYKKSLLN